MLQIVLDLAVAVSALTAVAVHIRHSSFPHTMKYFTAQSNVFCAFASLAAALFLLAGHMPQAVSVIRFMGVVTVTITMLTVLLFLGPQYGYQRMYAGPDLWLHLLCPVLALISYFVSDRPAAPAGFFLFGLVPVVLYGILYYFKTVYPGTKSKWKDFYGFNKNGRWPLSFMIMLLAAGAISALLWLL